MKVLWTHNFNPEIPNSGRFMHILAEGVRREGVDIEVMYLGALGSVNRIRRARLEVMHRSKLFDITHAQFGSACALVSAAARNIKVVSLRGSDWHRYRADNWPEYRHGILAVLFTRIALGSFNGVLVMSRRMASEVRATLHPDVPLQILADPVDTSKFVPKNRQDARRELGFGDDNSPWVLFTTLSETNPVKRPDLARRAMEIAAKSVPGLKLKVATGLDHASMPTFVSACNIVLCTSTHEGWPNSIKEALACGLPFVSTDVSDLADIGRQHPSCVISSGDPLELSAAILRSLAVVPEPGLRDVAQSMNVEATSRKLVDYYHALLQDSKVVQ